MSSEDFSSSVSFPSAPLLTPRAALEFAAGLAHLDRPGQLRFHDDGGYLYVLQLSVIMRHRKDHSVGRPKFSIIISVATLVRETTLGSNGLGDVS